MRKSLALGAAFAALLGSVPASAQTAVYVVDQSAAGMPIAVGNSTYNDGPVGQSFTPTLTGINFVNFTLADFNRGASVVSVSLYQGLGFDSNRVLLGQTNTVTFTNTTYQSIEFDFASLIALTPGATYSFVFNNPMCASGLSTCASDGSVLTTGGDTYAGGGAFRRGFQGDDYTFSEGIKTAIVPTPGVPEPTVWAMMILGVGAIGAVLRRGIRVSNRRFDAKIRRMAAGDAA